MKKKKFFILLIAISIIMCMVIANKKSIYNKIEKIKINQYGAPIDTEGTINNAYFNIDENLQNAKETTKGINEAISYADKNGIEYIKLKKGKYKIQTDGWFQNNKGIKLCSNMTFDLNGAEIIIESNDSPEYAIFYMEDSENISIINGVITGDREEHEYTDKSTHEWGFGIEIKSCNDIRINNVEIRNTTGDGIYIGKNINKHNSKKVTIENCNIYQCRRQGISIISAENTKIRNNEIHNISGTNPQSAIDLESNRKDEVIDEIEIANNKLYDLGNLYSIKVQRNIYNVLIQENEISQDVLVYDAKEKVEIKNNTIKNGSIICYTNNEFINKMFELKNISIEDNKIVDGNINITRANQIAIIKNRIENGEICIKSCNLKLINNMIENKRQERQDYAYKIENIPYLSKKCYIYETNNQSFGNIENRMKIEENEWIEVVDDINKVEEN